MTRYIPNETSNRKLFVGTEASQGVPVTPDYRLLGTFTATEDAPLNRQLETTGGYDRYTTPKRTASTFAGSYAESLTYQSLPMLMQYGLRRGAAGVTDGNATPGYTYAKSPNFDTDDIATFTAQHFVDGLGFQNAGVRFAEWNISGDADAAEGAWQFGSTLFMRSNAELPGAYEGVLTGATATTLTITGAGWTVNEKAGAYVFVDFGTHIGEVRRVVSNTATVLTVDEAFDVTPTAGDLIRIEGEFPAAIPIPAYDTIETYGTTVKIAPNLAGLATSSVINDRIISWNVSVGQTITPKRFMENAINEVSQRSGKGERTITFQVRFELDRRDEWTQWRNLSEMALGIYQTGPDINPDGSNEMAASIVIPRGVWDTFTPDERGSNLTATIAGLAYLPVSDPILTVTAKNDLATLP